MKNLILALLLTISSGVNASTTWTPEFIHTLMNVYIEPNSAIVAGYVSGVDKTFKTLQNYGIMDEYICSPYDIDFVDLRKILNDIDYEDYEDSVDGGIEYIFYALFKKYPCK